MFGSIAVAALVAIAIIKQQKLSEHQKKLLFTGIAAAVIIVTLFLVGSTIYLNAISATKGPVHWHADFEIWLCGEKVSLKDPTSLANRIGTSSFHEHNDARIHLEGVMIDESHADLHTFFEALGGKLEKGFIAVPTNDGLKEARDGSLCSSKPAKLQVFRYKVINAVKNKKSGFVTVQEKIADFTDYVLSPYSNVPPGDCIIIEFAEEKEKTGHLCRSYETAKQNGDLIGA